MPDSLLSSVNVIKHILFINSVVVVLIYLVRFCLLINIVFKKRDIKYNFKKRIVVKWKQYLILIYQF